MTTKRKKTLQREFLHRAATTTQTLDDLMEDLGILPQTLVRWMGERDFRSKLHGMRRYLARARDLQLEAASFHAARLLSTLTTVPHEDRANSTTRSACVDVIRLARDSRARRRANEADEVNRQRRLAHPDISDEEATRLMLEMEAESKPKGA